MGSARKKASFLKVVLILLVFAVSFTAGTSLTKWGMTGFSGSPDNNNKPKPREMPERLNVLLLGIDAREGETNARADSVMLVSIDRETRKIAVVSIPRETRVEIPGHGTDRVNAANRLSGAYLARETVEKLLDLEIPYYVKTNFEGFQDIVETLGGVKINVDKRMYNPAAVETISGTVESVDKITPMKGMMYGVHLSLKTDKETISVHLGP